MGNFTLGLQRDRMVVQRGFCMRTAQHLTEQRTHTKVSVPEDTHASQVVCGWQAGPLSRYDSYCLHTKDTSYLGGKMPCFRLFHPLPSFILTLKKEINFKGRSVTINTNTLKEH